MHGSKMLEEIVDAYGIDPVSLRSSEEDLETLHAKKAYAAKKDRKLVTD